MYVVTEYSLGLTFWNLFKKVFDWQLEMAYKLVDTIE